MRLSDQQQMELRAAIQLKLMELKRSKHPIKSGVLWVAAWKALLSGADFQAALRTVENFSKTA